jgi:hypothetical protein
MISTRSKKNILITLIVCRRSRPRRWSLLGQGTGFARQVRYLNNQTKEGPANDDYAENSQLIAEKIPGAELFTVEGANHGVHAEKPEVVLPKIRSHLGI